MKLSLKTNAIKSFGKTVENDIKSLEKVLNIKFPNDYKDFLLKTNGGSIPNDNTNEIVLKNIGKIINIDILYGVNTDNSCFDIEYWTKKYIDRSVLPVLSVKAFLSQNNPSRSSKFLTSD